MRRMRSFISFQPGEQRVLAQDVQIGPACMDTLRALKAHFDPRFILNPGGTLGLDMNEEQTGKRWGMRG